MLYLVLLFKSLKMLFFSEMRGLFKYSKIKFKRSNQFILLLEFIKFCLFLKSKFLIFNI